MDNLILNKIISDVCYIVVTTFTGVATFYFKRFLNSKKNFLANQEAILKQKLGIDQYNKDIAIAKDIVLSVEEIAKSCDWKGEVKHLNAINIIKGKTNLSDSDIDMIIKSVVAELNKNKVKTS